MRRNPKIILGFIVLLRTLYLPARAEDSVPFDRNFTGPITDPKQVCMVRRTIQATTPYKEDFLGKTYHFCCTMCLTKFKANPEQEKWATDPVKGKKVDKADALIYSYKGRAYFFGSKRSLTKFAKNPEKYRETQ